MDKLKQLRQETGVSYSLCKKALDEAKGDLSAAKKLLSEWGESVAAKKAGRSTSEGAVFSYIHHNKRIGVLLTVLCETDFVARNSEFLQLGQDIALQIASIDPKDTQELLTSEFIKDPTKTISQLLKEHIVKIGENITIGEFARFEI